MRLGTKIISAALGAVAVTVVIGLVIQARVIRAQGIELTRNSMRATLLGAENVRESVSTLGKRGAFDLEKLLAEAKGTAQLDQSTVYRTIPVVAAWTSIEAVAKRE